MARWKCRRCHGEGQKPWCISCMKVRVDKPVKTVVRRTQEERVSDIEQKQRQDIIDFRNNTQRKDLSRMLRNMKKVGLKTTGIPSLDMKLREMDPEIIVDDLDMIRLNMLRIDSDSCGVPELDQRLEQRFGPRSEWLEFFKDTLIRNMLDKCGLAWLDLKLIETYGPREEWKLI